jgi:hypothetical protein
MIFLVFSLEAKIHFLTKWAVVVVNVHTIIHPAGSEGAEITVEKIEMEHNPSKEVPKYFN